MRSLYLKLLAGTVLVALVAVVVIAIAARQSTDRAFTDYVRQNQTQRLQRLQDSLTDYYTRTQSWSNVQTVLSASGMGPVMGRMGRGSGSAGMPAGMQGEQQAVLADAEGVVVASIGAAHASPRLTARETEAALPIVVNGNTVGYLLGQNAGMSSFSALEEEFIATVNRALWLASLVAGVVAVAISLFLARRLAQPLVSMTQAAQAMARGDLSQRVHVTSGDEVGRLAEAFNTMAASLAHAEALRRNLVADVAHELRTPLSVLRADLEALQDNVYEPTPERLAALREETDLLARLVADLHELTLAEAGQLTMEKRPTDLVQVCRQVVGAMDAQAAGRGVALRLESTAAEAIANADPDRLGQVLRNLISNALRYTPAGGSVTVGCRVDGADALISVRDTGSGIKPDDLPHIFDRFYRGEKSRARATGGAGLGLAIVKQLVQAHGGRVWAESAPGEGAVFHIRLPLV